MSSDPSSKQIDTLGQAPRVTALVTDQSGKRLFTLTYRGEVTPLVDSNCLNRWSASGIIDRHNLAIHLEGVSVDGHKICFTDPHAIEELERIFNRQASPSHPHAAGHSGHAKIPEASAAEVSVAARIAESVQVTRDGFEFHVCYRTRFGEMKTEKLEQALEGFQSMRVFRPHVNLQKSGIRLVVTRWDGESFIEEPGIENIEHATPDQVGQLIRSNLLGQGDESARAANLSNLQKRRHVVRIEIIKRPHDSRFHLVFHRNDGTTEQGPLLIRPNMVKLEAEDLFQPGVSVTMTALNDRIIVAHHSPNDKLLAQPPEMLPLRTDEDAKAVEAILNKYLKPLTACPVSEGSATGQVTKPVAQAVVSEAMQTTGPTAPRTSHSAPPKLPLPQVPVRSEPPSTPTAVVETQPAPSTPLETPRHEHVQAPVEAPFLAANWVCNLLKSMSGSPMDEVNEGVFSVLRTRFNQPLIHNEHGYPQFTVDVPHAGSGTIALELVLAPHYLLCTVPMGYVRFGSETRVFLTRLDDYISFPQSALRGAAETHPAGTIAFVVSDEFARFLRTHSDRSYKAQFGELLLSMNEVKCEHNLLWPSSREEQLFQLLTAAAKEYGLPVTTDAVVLDPSAPEFIGFRRASPHGIEFRDGDDFARFTPLGMELTEDGQDWRFAGGSMIVGWALDSDGRICALYRKTNDFAPPPPVRLLRFVAAEDSRSAERSLNILASLPN